MNDQIKVGIVGVSAERGWATVAHIPAIKSLPQFKLTAISNRNPGLAAGAAKVHEVAHAFQTNDELINSNDVDLVVVTVKVPEHKTVVEAAINAGKNIYCEWPLGNGLAEAEELTQKAKDKGVYGVVGLQSRAVPAINFIKDLVKEGYVGEVLSTTLIGSGIYYGAFTDQATAYAMDAKNGAGMIYSTFGNSIDALCYCLGEFSELNATAINRRKTTTVVETGEDIPMTAFDQIAIAGVLESGAVATAHFRGGMFKGTNFFWEINGTKGDLVITADGGHPGVFALTIKGGQDNALAEIAVPEKYFHVNKETAHGPAYNIAENYIRLADDLTNGTHFSATFENALIRHRMINAIEQAAATGQKQSYLK